uniref:CHORD domain-containing protein n=1 Tax=Chromera velia CCMP2878 TaxID=1169474 RepID=A0A0G4EZ79_9ALVE|mmetsp:Transcript_24332/g.47762  ORF Transcript_24332/g.47762 Transcript_24332/m.47762 type:complete len:86 (-) Transcript_24332:126-383(-)|eukprot:Cvel_14358.t1-p1 / transcript=Cvel_14358.t1 / gene=Cvel_14358 / organism=Chromera_velia_CCMP2878 / gene_product=hypothetical protein / transcript_product=hypothetical protein / location=Cvel_scaffold1018:22327-24407(-) / protein_length=85 / sequence_SO=supercontig / SO=protein_coding / is_pseudo=false
MPPGRSSEQELLCRQCRKYFSAKDNSPMACAFHPGPFACETKQRFQDPGDSKDGGGLHLHWWCCSETAADAPGCERSRHLTYDDD